MRRAGGLWPRIASFENLLRAARRAALGKRRAAGVARFLERAEPEALALERDLESGEYRPGRAFTFKVYDPKERTITAAPFRDRVVHHALIDVLEPVFERRMISGSFACRRGKGTRAALEAARRHLRRFDFFLKLDIRRCFDSISHGVVVETLERIIKDRRVLVLCRVILAGSRDGECSGRGLPIGNLTSQWFANLVLDRLDHHVKEVMRIPGYVRYMDDFVLFSGVLPELKEALVRVRAFLDDRLGLALKARATILAPASQGLPFLGWKLYRGTCRLRPENVRRTKRRLRRRLGEFRRGLRDEGSLADCVRSVVSHLREGRTLGLRRSLFHEIEMGGGPDPPCSASRAMAGAPPATA